MWKQETQETDRSVIKVSRSIDRLFFFNRSISDFVQEIE